MKNIDINKTIDAIKLICYSPLSKIYYREGYSDNLSTLN